MQINPEREESNAVVRTTTVISGVYTLNNRFLTPHDGYVFIYMTNAGSVYDVHIADSTSPNNTNVCVMRGQTTTAYEFHSLFVKKGMYIGCDTDQSTSAGDAVYYRALKD